MVFDILCFSFFGSFKYRSLKYRLSIPSDYPINIDNYVHEQRGLSANFSKMKKCHLLVQTIQSSPLLNSSTLIYIAIRNLGSNSFRSLGRPKTPLQERLNFLYDSSLAFY